MTRARHHGRNGTPCLGAATASLLILLTSGPGAAGPPTPEAASFKSEWDKVREDQEREIRSNRGRLADIVARERREPAELEARADKITRERVAEIRAYVKSDTRGAALAQTAEQALSQRGTLAEIYKAQEAFVSNASRDWAKDG